MMSMTMITHRQIIQWINNITRKIQRQHRPIRIFWDDRIVTMVHSREWLVQSNEIHPVHLYYIKYKDFFLFCCSKKRKLFDFRKRTVEHYLERKQILIEAFVRVLHRHRHLRSDKLVMAIRIIIIFVDQLLCSMMNAVDQVRKAMVPNLVWIINSYVLFFFYIN